MTPSDDINKKQKHDLKVAFEGYECKNQAMISAVKSILNYEFYLEEQSMSLVYDLKDSVG